MYRLCVIALLLCFKLIFTNSSNLIELTADGFNENTQAGRTALVYFCTHADASVQTFLEQLGMSAEALQDYGILVAKVNCSKENVPKFCTGEKIMRKAHLFRGSDVLRSFDLDTIFDVNAVVSHMLFTLLYNEVRYVHTPAELLGVERAAKGKADVVLGHVSALGLPEHRALMEAAFVYGGKYQFVQTTGAPLLQHMGIEDGPSARARLWFLRCRGVRERSEPCPRTLMRRALTTVNTHAFLQLMEAPPLVEASADPDRVEAIYDRLGVPVLFLFSHAETLQADWETARALATRLRGEIGVVLVHRNSPGVQTALAYNAAYRLPRQEVKYLSVKDPDEVVSLIRGQAEEDEDEDEDRFDSYGVLDDEVAESVYRERGVEPDTDSVAELTPDTFGAAVTQSGLTVVLFYLRWDAASMAFLHSYGEVADSLKEVSDVSLASVDCGEWTCVCRERNVTSFPSVRLFRPDEEPRSYRGMMGTESLYRFLLLSRLPAPVSLSSSAEALSFLEAEQYSELSPVRMLGLFSHEDPDAAVFREASRALRGEAVLGLFADGEAQKWAEEHSVAVPALLVARGPGVRREAHPLPRAPQEMEAQIRRAVLDTFPELSVQNLPWYLELRRPLLLLFVGGEESPETLRALDEMRRTERGGRPGTSLPCWIHLGRTPSGRSVLESYLGFVPPLPALVLSRLSSDGQVYHFPSERPLLAENIIEWLRSIEDGQEQPAGLIPDGSWTPLVPFYDFLAVMDEEAPGYASQQGPKETPGGKTRQRSAKTAKVQDEGEEEEDKGTNGRGSNRNHPAPHRTEL